MRADTGMDIWEATSAGNDPGDGSNDGISDSNWTARISHAHTLVSCGGQSADGVGMDEGTVVSGVTGLAVGVGQSPGVNKLQVGRCRSGVLNGRKTKINQGQKHKGQLKIIRNSQRSVPNRKRRQPGFLQQWRFHR